MALTAAQLNSIFENVLFRPAEPAAIAFYANRTDVSDAQIRQQIELSPEAVVFTNPVIRLFEAAFNRTPSQADLRFYGQELKAGLTTEQVAFQLASSPEFAAAQPGGVVTAAFVQNLYQDLLNRAASPAEVAYYVARTPAQVINGLANSPEATQAQASSVITFLDSAAQGSPNTGDLDNQASQIPGGGTGDGGNVGTTFTLTGPTNPNTGGVDDLVGTAGNDTFRAITANALDSVDTINGGAGTDTLNINATGLVTGAAPIISNLEIINNASTAVLDLSDVTGVATINSTGATAEYTGADLGTNFTITDDTVLTVAFDDVTGTDDTATFTATDTTGVAEIDAAGVENVNLTVTSTDDATTETLLLTDADLVSLTVTGNSEIELTSTATTIETFNASASTGGVTFTSGILTEDFTAQGGSGADVLDFTAATGEGLITGGAGADTLTGGTADDIFGGGTGVDSIVLTAGGNDEVHVNGGAGGLDTVTDFTETAGVNADVVSFLDNGAITFANSTDDATRGDSDLDADDYVEFAAIADLEAVTDAADLDQKVVNITGNSTDVAINTLETQVSAEFYAVFTDGADTSVYYDADWSTLDGRTQIVELTGVAATTIDNFDVYVA